MMNLPPDSAFKSTSNGEVESVIERKVLADSRLRTLCVENNGRADLPGELLRYLGGPGTDLFLLVLRGVHEDVVLEGSPVDSVGDTLAHLAELEERGSVVGVNEPKDVLNTSNAIRLCDSSVGVSEEQQSVWLDHHILVNDLGDLVVVGEVVDAISANCVHGVFKVLLVLGLGVVKESNDGHLGVVEIFALQERLVGLVKLGGSWTGKSFDSGGEVISLPWPLVWQRRVKLVLLEDHDGWETLDLVLLRERPLRGLGPLRLRLLAVTAPRGVEENAREVSATDLV